MKRRSSRIAFLFLLFLMPLLSACSGKSKLVEDQKRLHQEFVHYFESALQQVEQADERYAAEFSEKYGDGACSKQGLLKTKSSVYIPKSAVKGKKLDCLRSAAPVLDDLWDRFYEETDFISWQYIYDDETKCLILHPATSTDALFGEDFAFDSTYFFRGAVSKYPDGWWSDVRDDMNGTGKIIIYSRAARLKGNDSYTVFAIDIQTNQVLKTYHHKILDHSLRHKLNHVFSYAYLKDGDRRSFVHDFSTNPHKWRVLKLSHGDILNISSEGENSLLEMEALVKEKPLQVVSKKVRIEGKPYLCSMSKLRKLDIYSFMCSEV